MEGVSGCSNLVEEVDKCSLVVEEESVFMSE